MSHNNQAPAPGAFTLTLRKESSRALSPDSLDAQLAHIRARALGGHRAQRGWHCRASCRHEAPSSPGQPHAYLATFAFGCKPRRHRSPESIRAEWDHVVKVATAAGNAKGWLPAEVEGHKARRSDERLPSPVEYADFTLPANWKDYFRDIYDRDDQLEVVMSALREAVDSRFANRFNVILFGPAGSGKSDICRQLKRMLPPDSYLEFDCTNTTMAGAIEELRGRERMPRVLILEEAEKADPDAKRWLLAATDLRAEIRKVTFRGTVQRDTHLVCVATANDLGALRAELAGALESRFPFQVECPHPDERTMRKILERELRRRVGFRESDLAWIEPVIAFGQELGITDPRKLVAYCLCGKDQLLTGGYLDRVRRTLGK